MSLLCCKENRMSENNQLIWTRVISLPLYHQKEWKYIASFHPADLYLYSTPTRVKHVPSWTWPVWAARSTSFLIVLCLWSAHCSQKSLHEHPDKSIQTFVTIETKPSLWKRATVVQCGMSFVSEQRKCPCFWSILETKELKWKYRLGFTPLWKKSMEDRSELYSFTCQ